MTTEPHSSDSFEREARNLEANDWYYRLNAAGSSLSMYFNYSGVPLAFPQLNPGENLVFEHLEHGDNEVVQKTEVVHDYDEMCEWYMAGRFYLTDTVVGWRISKEPEDPSAKI